MTLKEIKARIEEIKKVEDDDERAHSKEDDLREDFIFFIASSGSSYAILAREILKSNKIRFNRWYA